MSNDVRALKDKATQLTTKGKLPAALQAWREVVAAAPDDVAAQQKVAELLVKQGDKAGAAKTYESVARGYAEKGLFFKASAICRLLTAIEPGHTRTQDYIASLFASAKAAPVPSRPAPVASPAAVPPPPPEEAMEIEIELEPAPTASGLPRIPLFSTLSQEELREILATTMEVRAVKAGEVVVEEGTQGTSMYALVEGAAGVFRAFGKPMQRRVSEIAAGDIFGEVAMISGAARLATVVADVDGVVLEFSRDAIGAVITKHARVRQMLERFYRERLLANALRASTVLRGLPAPTKGALVNAFQVCTFKDGQTIIAEGQPPEWVHMVLRGTCAVSHQSGERYPDMHEGDLFGELSVLMEGPATATVRALGPVLTLRLPASGFRERVLKDAGAALAVKKEAKLRLERTRAIDDGTPQDFGDARV